MLPVVFPNGGAHEAQGTLQTAGKHVGFRNFGPWSRLFMTLLPRLRLLQLLPGLAELVHVLLEFVLEFEAKVLLNLPMRLPGRLRSWPV